MILLSDSQKDQLIDNRWLIKPFYISKSEIERILDEIPALIEKTKKYLQILKKRMIKKNFLILPLNYY